MIFVGDIHHTHKEPFNRGHRKLWEFLYENYSHEILIQLGDLYDTSSPNWDTFTLPIEYISRWKNEVIILHGNHDRSFIKGSALDGMRSLNKVLVIDENRVLDIEGKKVLFMPYPKKSEDYHKLTELKGQYDLIATHITEKKYAFGSEGLSFPNLKGTFIHGHIHSPDEYYDEFGNTHIICGVPQTTRNGEQDYTTPKRIIRFDKGSAKPQYIPVPKFVDITTVVFPEKPKDNGVTEWQLNVLNAPSVRAVYEEYSDYEIRRAGIVLSRPKDLESSEKDEDIESMGLREQFIHFAGIRGLPENITTFAEKYL